jgi:hypothetical protein
VLTRRERGPLGELQRTSGRGEEETNLLYLLVIELRSSSLQVTAVPNELSGEGTISSSSSSLLSN